MKARSCKRLLTALAVASLILTSIAAVHAEEKKAAETPVAAAMTTAPASAEVPVAAPSATAEPLKPDPVGADTGVAGDVVGATAGAPTADELKNMAKSEPLAAKLADVIGHNRIAINMSWLLLCGFLVMFMQTGFALLETGLVRSKNANHTMAMNIMIYCIGLMAYWAVGFGLQMGGAGPFATLGGGGAMNGEFTIKLFGKDLGIFGMKGFFLSGDAYDVSTFAMFLFQMVFMDAAATIPTGAMAERFKFSSFVVYGFIMTGVIYPLYANWVWGGGWLATLGSNFGLGHGHVDFAGSSVVHMVGGVSALVGAYVIGPRRGKYNKDGSPNAIPGHDIPMAITGCLILAFGWFGFNTGSTLAGGDLRIGVVATNTMIASAFGGFAAMIFMWIKYKKPDLTMSANGLLAGLVAITAPCAFVNSVSAAIIGTIAGVLCCSVVFFVERVLKIDDPVGAVAVHCANGAWGVLSLGLFADGTYGDGLNGVKGMVKGLFYGDASQFMAQVTGTLTNFIFVGVSAFIMFKIINAVMGLRVSEDVEYEGLDVAEVAVEAYPDFDKKA